VFGTMAPEGRVGEETCLVCSLFVVGSTAVGVLSRGFSRDEYQRPTATTEAGCSRPQVTCPTVRPVRVRYVDRTIPAARKARVGQPRGCTSFEYMVRPRRRKTKTGKG
jgi:hypothetical protein